MPTEPQPSEWLIQSGAFTREEYEAASRDAHNRVAQLASQTRREALAASLSVVEAAAKLGIAPDELNSRHVYVFTTEDGERRVPAWVFESTGKLLPGLQDLVVAIRASGLHYASVRGFMGTPQRDLGGATPVEWLTGAGDVGAVTQILGLAR